jgi:hypothetical protein
MVLERVSDWESVKLFNIIIEMGMGVVMRNGVSVGVLIHY